MKNLFKEKTKYNDVIVAEENGIRYLLFGNGASREQSAIKINAPNEIIFDYAAESMKVFNLVKSPSRVLVVGLGAGIIPRAIANLNEDVFIDIIEIDPLIYDISQNFFGFKTSSNMKIIIGDAYGVMPYIKDTYDIIFMDAYNGSYIPFHLMSQNFYSMLKKMINNGGVIVQNISPYHPSYNSHMHTIITELGENIYYSVPPENKYNKILYIINSDDNINGLNKIGIGDEILSAPIFTIPQ